jgi:hypothetical protein
MCKELLLKADYAKYHYPVMKPVPVASLVRSVNHSKSAVFLPKEFSLLTLVKVYFVCFYLAQTVCESNQSWCMLCYS